MLEHAKKEDEGDGEADAEADAAATLELSVHVLETSPFQSVLSFG